MADDANSLVKSARAKMLDIGSSEPTVQSHWSPVKISRHEIAEAVERLSALDIGPGQRRTMSIVHPSSTAPGLGLTPGLQVAINVVKAGEITPSCRQNAAQVNISIAGSGFLKTSHGELALGKWDVCNIPSMQVYQHRNDGQSDWVFLSYSNAPLLEKLGVHFIETGAAAESPRQELAAGSIRAEVNRGSAPDIPMDDYGARLRGYEFLTDIEVVPSLPHVWSWSKILPELSTAPDDGKRGIMLLYNPATERRNGTTHSFFVTASSVAPGAPPRPVGRGHRHSSVAINYHFAGSGWSRVGDEEISWEAGDLLLSAPGWSEHAHYMNPEGAMVFTVQDHPLQIGMESLIWQEDMSGPILTLGSEAGVKGYIGPRQKA